MALGQQLENASRRRYGPRSRKLAQAIMLSALVLQHLGKHELALAKSEEALEIVENTLGRGHPLITGALNMVANNNYYLGKSDVARELYERMLTHFNPDSAEYVQNPSPSSILLFINSFKFRSFTTMHNLANILDKEGKVEEAEDLYRQVVAYLERRISNEHLYTSIKSDLAGAYLGLASCLTVLRRHTEALSSLERAHVLYSESFPAGHVYAIYSLILSLRPLTIFFHSQCVCPLEHQEVRASRRAREH
jgi:tetratricopeptide (TPR) repeat protein